MRLVLSGLLLFTLTAIGCERERPRELEQTHAALRGGRCLERSKVLICGSTNRRGDALYTDPALAALGLTEADGCVPDADTQALLITRGVGTLEGDGSYVNYGAQWRDYLRAGGRIITEWDMSHDVHNAITGSNYVRGGDFPGDCQDNIMPGVKLNPDHPFWQTHDYAVTPVGRQSCSFDIANVIAGENGKVVALGSLVEGTVTLAYRDVGYGTLFLSEADWQDGEQNYSDDSRRLMGGLITACGGFCGDNTVQEVEGCDDGNGANGDGCTAACKIEDGHPCGSGAGLGGNESCASGICDTTGNPQPGVCEPANTCGNGVLDAGEFCDDGNTADGDTCSATCKLGDGQPCDASGSGSCASGICDIAGNPQPGVCEPANTCGNGTLEANEGCDDGNTLAADGCDDQCKIEVTLPCNQTAPGLLGNPSCQSGACNVAAGLPGVCVPSGVCGNGVLEQGEGCDDSNTTAGDGCASACKIETGSPCGSTPPGSTGNASCESGACNVLGGEPGTCVAAGVCGNGVLDQGEECDDGDTDGGDGCSSTCTIETITDGGVTDGGVTDGGDGGSDGGTSSGGSSGGGSSSGGSSGAPDGGSSSGGRRDGGTLSSSSGDNGELNLSGGSCQSAPGSSGGAGFGGLLMMAAAVARARRARKTIRAAR